MPILQLAKEGVFNGNMQITRDKLDQMAANAVDDVPVIVSHYQMGEHSGGWIRKGTIKTELVDGEYSLTGQVDFLPELQEAIDQEHLKHWSILALPTEEGGAYKLFHLAFLGANLPAISGLKKLSDTISASQNINKAVDGALICEYSVINMKNGVNMDEIKELQEEVGALKLELSKTKESSESDKLELQKQFDSVKESNEALELDNANLKKQVAEYENKKFDDILLQLEKSGDGKMNVEDLKSLVKEFKDEGISCKAQVERQIRIFEKMNSVVPGNEMIIENNNVDEQNKKNEAQKKARKAKM